MRSEKAEHYKTNQTGYRQRILFPRDEEGRQGTPFVVDLRTKETGQEEANPGILELVEGNDDHGSPYLTWRWWNGLDDVYAQGSGNYRF